MMKYTTLSSDEIRKAVYEEAKRQFFEYGIAGTEMRRIANNVGIGRATLYRYFSSVDQLAFMAVTEFLHKMNAETYEYQEDAALNGIENVHRYYDLFISVTLRHPDYLAFFQQFDQQYPSRHTEAPESEEFSREAHERMQYMLAMFCKGQSDGSIRKDIDTEAIIITLENTLFGLAQRMISAAERTSDTVERSMKWVAHALIDSLKP